MSIHVEIKTGKMFCSIDTVVNADEGCAPENSVMILYQDLEFPVGRRYVCTAAEFHARFRRASIQELKR